MRTKPLGRYVIAGFLFAALLLAGGLSYLADPAPDALEASLQKGCTERDGALTGSCPAQHARGSDGFFADYTIGGNEALVGVAGVLGVLVTLVVALGLFFVVKRRTR